MGRMMSPQAPMQGHPMPRGWRERWMLRFGMSGQMPRAKELTVPNWLTGKSIVFFFVSLFLCWLVFGFVPDFALWIVASFSILLFFYGGQAMSRSWERKKEKTFLRNVFIAGFVIRLIWVLYCYFFFNPEYYGSPVGDRADVEWYMPYGQSIADWVRGDIKISFSELMDMKGGGVDDVGYPIWLAIIFLLFGNECDVFIFLAFKVLMSAYCAIYIYRIAKRHYGDGVARMAAIFVCFFPNMIYWCGTMFKEVEMVFLCCMAIDNFDRVLSSGQRYTFKNLIPGIFATFAVFFFRSALAILILLAVFAHIIMASNRVMSLGKKILAGILVTSVLFVAMGDRIRTQSRQLVEAAQSDRQDVNMEWRSTRSGGNSFAKYASAAVFAPLIFTIPFPTFNSALESQYLQVQLAGGSYIKNILSFFVILVLFMLLISGEWRRHVFILAYTVGYHVILVMSEFAQSGRFHMPVIPMIMLFAAYGIQVAKTNAGVRKWFPIVLALEVVACLAWNWFKLKGRGLI